MRAALLLASFIGVVGVARPSNAAEPGPKAVCATAYEEGQLLRRGGQLLAARAALVTCAERCAHVFRADCAEWLAAVDKEIPSIVVAARDPDGADVTDVRVSSDDRPIAERLDPRGLELDPGEHVLRFERAGSPPVERRIVLRAGEKLRPIEVQLVASPAAPAPAPAPSPVGPPSSGSRASPPLVAVVLAGLGAVALATFAGFGIAGRSEQVRVLDRCRGSCSESQIDSVREKYLVADVSLGIGVVCLAASAFFLFTGRTARPALGGWIPRSGIAW